AGKANVVNAISCMHCHQNGMIRFSDTVRGARGVFGAAQQKVERLYPEKKDMDRLLDKDEDKFLRALDEAIRPFLKLDKKIGIQQAPDPVYFIAQKYIKEDVDLPKAASELGIEDPKKLQILIEANPNLRKYGLGPLATGATIKRETWESLTGRFYSQFQDAASELDLGAPYRVRR